VELNIGLWGLGILVVVSLAFGIIAQVVLGRGSSAWLWLIGAIAWFIGGFIASEVVWGSATGQELQPIIDGLAFDESVLGGLLAGLAAILATWYVTRQSHLHGPTAAE